MSRKLRRQRQKLEKQSGGADPFRQAVHLFQGGRLQEALKLCRKILVSRPDHAEALGLGAMAAFQAGDKEQALELFGAAAKANPESASAHNDFGVALHACGNIEQAVDSFRRAIELDQNFTEAQNNLGVQLHNLGKLDKAETVLRQAIDGAPEYAEAHCSLGNVLMDLGRLDEAAAAFEKSIQHKPGYELAYHSLLLTLKAQGRLEDVIAALNRYLELAPDDASKRVALGDALFNLAKFDEAETAYRRALEINPNHADGHHNLGLVLQSLGRLDEAVAAFRRAIEIEPAAANSYRHLAVSKKFVEEDSEVKAMKDLLAGVDDQDEKVINLCFALGKAFDDIGEYDQAFSHFERGNRVKSASLNYDIAEDEEKAKRIARQFDADYLSGDGGFHSEAPIFVLGMPRSGTTLIEQILASHSQVHGAGEIDDFRNLAPQPDHRLGPEETKRLGKAYVEGLAKLAPKAIRITDKTPANFFYIGLIHMALPGAKIIHCVRGPADTCLSCYMQYFTETQAFAYELTDLGRYWRMYANLMDHWRAVLPGKILDVRYEDMVADQQAESRKLVEFCGLQWEDSCLDFHKSKRPVRTASLEQVRRPVYKGSVKRWQRYKDHLGPLLKALPH